MSRGQALAQLIRLRDMKAQRLAEYTGSEGGRHFLKCDIAALEYAIELIDYMRRAERAAS